MAQIKKLRYNHEAMLNWLIENPDRPLRDAAEYFGVTQSWLSTVINSDIFQEKLIERQAEVAEAITQTLQEKLQAAAHVAIDGLTRAIEGTENPKFLLDASDRLLHRLGYAPQARAVPQQIVQNNTLIQQVDPKLLEHSRSLLVPAIEETPSALPKEETPIGSDAD